MWFKFKTIRNKCGTSFLHRLSFYFKKGSIKLHIITGDDSHVFHTHPWDFTSLIIFGGYKEYIQFPWIKNEFGIVSSSNLDFEKVVNDSVRVMKGFGKSPFCIDVEDTTGLIHGYKHRMFTVNRKLHNQLHRVELFKVFGIKIPAITIGIYSQKLQLCSFCKEAGYCLQSKTKTN